MRHTCRIGSLVLLLILVARLAAAQEAIILAWDPNPEPEVIGYRVYVGTQPGVYAATYDVEWYQTSFVLPSPVGGVTYYLAVAARAADGVIGLRSEEVSATAALNRYEPPPSADGCPFGCESERWPLAAPLSAATLAPGGAGVICVDAAGADCYVATVIASGLGAVSSLVAAGRGRLLFIEDERTVQVLSGPGRAPVTALQVHRDDIVLAGLALDPAFARTGLVFIAESEARRDGRRDARIVRYRELAGTLGEAAAVIAGLPLPASGHAPFALDAERNIYVAVPGSPLDDGWSVDPYAGHLLRFRPDGGAAPVHASGSPVLARGPVQPTALAWDVAGPRLWIGGREEPARLALARLDLPDAEPAEWPVPPEVVRFDAGETAGGASLRIVSLALTGGPLPEDSRHMLLVAGDGRLYRAQVTEEPVPAPLRHIPLDRFGEAVAVAAGPQDDFYIVVRDAAVPATYTILEFAR